MTTNNYPVMNQNQMQYNYTNEPLSQQPVYVVQQPVVVGTHCRRSGNGTALVTGMLVGGMLAGGMRGPRPFMGPRMGPRRGYGGNVCCEIF